MITTLVTAQNELKEKESTGVITEGPDERICLCSSFLHHFFL
jgi:hypothetical protein